MTSESKVDDPPQSSKDDDQSSQGISVSKFGLEDKPVPSEHDKLGFTPYVKAVASFLSSPLTKAPFTLSIEGEWGCGKSSFMLQLDEELSTSAEKFVTVKFNAWRHDKVESMWAAFALHFIDALRNRLNWIEKIVASIKLNWSRFDFQRGWSSLLLKIIILAFFIIFFTLLFRLLNDNPFTSLFNSKEEFSMLQLVKSLGNVGIILLAVFIIKKVVEILGNPLAIDLKQFLSTPDYSTKAPFIETFHNDFDNAVKILSKGSKKIFVFIDDLDRAEVPKAAELMQGLNMMISNSPRLVFIIGMDREKVAAGIAAKYKDLLNFVNPQQQSLNTEAGINQAVAFGHGFLEKFVQLSFRVPGPSPESLENFLSFLNPERQQTQPQEANTSTRRIEVGEDSNEFKQIIMLVAPYFDYNPRRLKQFINAFRLKTHIAYATKLFEKPYKGRYLTLQQLGKFVAMSMLWPSLIEDLWTDEHLVHGILDSNNISEKGDYWKNNLHLTAFLRLSSNLTDRRLPTKEYEMDFVNYKALLETSPPLTKPEQNKTESRYETPPKDLKPK